MQLDGTLGDIVYLDIDLNRDIDKIVINLDGIQITRLLEAAVKQLTPKTQENIKKHLGPVSTALFNRSHKIDIEFVPFINSKFLREHKSFFVKS